MRVDRADAIDLVGDDRHADPRPAGQDGAIGVPFGDQAARLFGVARVVDGIRCDCADVHDVVTLCFKHLPDVFLEVEPGVVGPDGDPHALRSSSIPSSMDVTGL